MDQEQKEGVKITERPDLYDWLYDDFTSDIPMYSHLVESHEEVLECGIGTGRIALPLASEGKIIYGIDNSSEMLCVLEKKMSNYPLSIKEKIKIFRADMRDFDLNRKFSLIYIPFSTFNYLLTVEDQKLALTSIFNHLNSTGELVIELLSPSYFIGWLDVKPVLKKVKQRSDPNSNKTIEMWKECDFNSASQIVTEHRYFKFFNTDGLLEREELIHWKNRLFFLGELNLLLEFSGFDIKHIYGDFNLGPYKHESEVFIVVAKRN